MKLNIYLEERELLETLFPYEFPQDLKKIILLYSGHLRIGHRSISWLMYF